jgi:RNA recognition motif-containing protein
MKILVRNLSRSTTEEELSELFSKFSNVEYCNLVLDKMSGKSKGFGFVEMADEKKALLAIVKLNGTVLGGKPIRVKKADEAV